MTQTPPTRSDRRQSSRTPVDFFVEERRGERTVLHPAINLSTTGLYLLAGDEHGAFDPSRELELEFTLPTGHVIDTRARIAYLDDRMGQLGLAVTFIDLADAHLAALSRFVEISSSARSRFG
jgi:hypothetical protein